MKFFFISLCFIFLFSCAEQIDIEATIDERAKKIAHEILNNRLTSTPQPTATPQAISSTDTHTLYIEARK